MKYKLGLCLGTEDYKIVDISGLFSDSYDLEVIDNFTMCFNNERELKTYLLQKKLLKQDELDFPLIIHYGVKNVKEIPVIYSNDKETIDKIRDFSKEIKKYFDERKSDFTSDFSYSTIVGDYKNIRNRFKSFNVMARNNDLLSALQEYASSNPKQNLNINDIELFKRSYNQNTDARLIHIALFELFRRMFYKYDEEAKELKFNYKSFRDFCVFYCEYKNNHIAIRNLQNQQEENRRPIEELLEEPYEEPIFPPNSEEEALYNEYLERLEKISFEPVEEHDHYRR